MVNSLRQFTSTFFYYEILPWPAMRLTSNFEFCELRTLTSLKVVFTNPHFSQGINLLLLVGKLKL